jgi:hypothetical protein
MPDFWGRLGFRNRKAPDRREVPVEQTYKFHGVSRERDSVLLTTDSEAACTYLAANLNAYLTILSSGGRQVPDFEYSVEGLGIRITGEDRAAVIARLIGDGLLTPDCIHQCATELKALPPSPFLEMEQAAQHAITCH